MASINTTMAASSKIQENLRLQEKKMEETSRAMSSGKRVYSASADAAGLAVSTRMVVKEDGLRTASDGMGRASDLLATADSSLNTVQDILQRMNDIALMGANGTWTDEDRELMTTEMLQLTGEVQHIMEGSHYNGIHLLTPDDPILIPMSEQSGDYIDLKDTLAAEHTAAGGATGSNLVNIDPFEKIDDKVSIRKEYYTPVYNFTGLSTALTSNAMDFVSQQRVEIGATMTRMDHAISNSNNAAINTSAAASRIIDADMAAEMSEMTKNKILAESSVSMLTQSNANAGQLNKLLDGSLQ